MSDKVYEVPAEWRQRAYVDDAKYQEMYERSIEDPNGFWAEQAKRIDWTERRRGSRTPRSIRTTSRSSGSRTARSTSPTTASTATWRSAATRPRSSGKATIPKDDKQITYRELHDEVCRFANVLQGARRQEGRPRHHLPADDPGGGLRDARLRAHRRGPLGGVRRLLAGQRSPAASRTADSKVVITADEGLRGGQHDAAQGERRRGARQVPAASSTCSWSRRTGGDGRHGCRAATSGTHEALPKVDAPTARREQMGAEDPLFILYTSGSTGKPKGVLHTTGGYLRLRRR